MNNKLNKSGGGNIDLIDIKRVNKYTDDATIKKNLKDLLLFLNYLFLKSIKVNDTNITNFLNELINPSPSQNNVVINVNVKRRRGNTSNQRNIVEIKNNTQRYYKIDEIHVIEMEQEQCPYFFFLQKNNNSLSNINFIKVCDYTLLNFNRVYRKNINENYFRYQIVNPKSDLNNILRGIKTDIGFKTGRAIDENYNNFISLSSQPQNKILIKYHPL